MKVWVWVCLICVYNDEGEGLQKIGLRIAGKIGPANITILRNGQSQVDLPINNWYPIYEDVSTDDSSIYMTSKQRIEFELASTNFATFGVDALSGTNTTQLLQDVPLENPNKSNKEADSNWPPS